VSRLGAHHYLINPEMSADQLLAVAERLRLDFVIYDRQIAHGFKSALQRDRSLPTYHPTDPSIDSLSSSSRAGQVRLAKAQAGNIVVMTGGTTGLPKSASRKPSILDYLPLLGAFLTQADLDQYPSLYISTPICHGYALSFLFIGVALGVEMYFIERFDAARACSLVATHQIQSMVVVPVILRRMLKLDPGALSSLQCIITGSALLRPALAQETIEQLGPILFNLYGSSEAGFSIMATPDVLSKKPESIGKPVQGVRVGIIDGSGQQVGKGQVGQVCIRSTWSADRDSWIETGDLAYRDAEGDIFLCGRVDDMIVSGGENVYPCELENVLTQHPGIEAAAVYGIPDEEFGQRLKAVVVKKRDTTLDRSTLRDWLKPRVARYQMPAVIEFRDALAHTSIGKLDKKSL
jgi:acyl-CoA synthetase (AMP-forming)/AMP-acid ligase II